MYEKLKLRRLDCKENQTCVEIEAGETFLGNIIKCLLRLLWAVGHIGKVYILL